MRPKDNVSYLLNTLDDMFYDIVLKNPKHHNKFVVN